MGYVWDLDELGHDEVMSRMGRDGISCQKTIHSFHGQADLAGLVVSKAAHEKKKKKENKKPYRHCWSH
jgi:hypothetical protein